MSVLSHIMCKERSFLILVIGFFALIHKAGADPCNICGDDDAIFKGEKLVLGGISCAALNDEASWFEDAIDCVGYQAYGLECECSNLIETEFVCKICPNGEDLPDPTRYIPFPQGTCGGFETTANLLVTDEEERREICYDAQRLAPFCCDNVEPFCTVCSPSRHVTIHDRIVPEFDPITCGELEAVAVTFRDPAQCLNAQLAARDFADFDGCGCEFIVDPFPLDEAAPEGTPSPIASPSKAPSPAPSPTPSAGPTPMPSVSPTPVPSKSPTGSPTSSPAPTAYTLPQQKTRGPSPFGTGDRSYGSSSGRGGAGNGGGGRGGAGAGGGGTGGGGLGRLLRGVIGE